MNSTEKLIKIIQEVVRKEIRTALKEELSKKQPLKETYNPTIESIKKAPKPKPTGNNLQDILNETANVAVERAVAFSNKIDESDPRLLSRASTTISSTSNIRPDQIVLRMTFVVNYGVTN